MTSSDDAASLEHDSRAEAVFLEFVRASAAGAPTDFDELCASRPELASELRTSEITKRSYRF